MNDRRNILFYFRVKDVHCVLSRQSIALSGRDHKEKKVKTFINLRLNNLKRFSLSVVDLFGVAGGCGSSFEQTLESLMQESLAASVLGVVNTASVVVAVQIPNLTIIFFYILLLLHVGPSRRGLSRNNHLG